MVVERQQDLAGVFQALADPTRLAILELLRGRDQCVCHLVEALNLKQSLISHHIGLLRRAGLVVSYPGALGVPDDVLAESGYVPCCALAAHMQESTALRARARGPVPYPAAAGRVDLVLRV